MPASADLAAPARYELIEPASAEVAALVRRACSLHGLAPDGAGAPVMRVAPLEALARLDDDALAALVHGGPALLVPEGASHAAAEQAARVLRAAGAANAEVSLREARAFRFGRAETLWPFRGLELVEAAARTVLACSALRAGEPLLTADGAPVVVALGDGGPVWLSLVPVTEVARAPLLKYEFVPDRFAALLPLVLFSRAARGAWRPNRLSATFLVDDPNLRLLHYGFLDFRAFLQASERHHLAIAMIPIDYRKTRREVAQLFGEHPDRLSLVPHGVDHLWCEFGAEVPEARAEATLAQGRARMEKHRRLTGLPHANAMTCPHGACGAAWLAAMRRVGFDAALISHARPFVDEHAIDDPLYELRRADTAVAGFPVFNRFKAEEPKERLLFAAALHKPLVVYTHHAFFRDGLDPLLEIGSFLDANVKPIWEGPSAILESCYDVRGEAVRVWSNSVRVGFDASGAAVAVKPTEDDVDDVALVDGARVPSERLDGAGLVAQLPPAASERRIEFRPRPPAPALPQPRVAVRSAARRFATELRDRTAPVVAAARR